MSPPELPATTPTAHAPVLRLATAQEVADALRVTPDRVYTLAREGRIPSVRLGRQLRFDLAGVVAHLVQSGGYALNERRASAEPAKPERARRRRAAR